MMKAIYTLSKKSQLYPMSLVLNDVKRVGSNYAANGSYGDIWKGIRAEKDVAIKVMRKRSTDVHCFKVRSVPPTTYNHVS